jgi:hypothetical protein
VQGYHSVLSANSHTADKQLPDQAPWLYSDSQHTYNLLFFYNRHNIGGRSILVVSKQLRHHSYICTYNIVQVPPRKKQQVLESCYSDDGGLAAHSSDDRAPGPAAMPAVSPASGSVRNPVASQYVMPSLKPKKQQLWKPEKQLFAFMVQQSSPSQEAVVVARTRVIMIQPWLGMEKRPFGITSTGGQSIT